MGIKRVCLTLLVIAVLSLVFTGCGDKMNPQPISTHDIATKLAEEVTASPMTEVQESYIAARFDIRPNILKMSSLYVSDNAELSDEVGVFEVRDKKDVDSVLEALSIHNNQKAQTFRQINSSEYQKIRTTLLMSRERYVFMVTCSQPVKAKALIEREFPERQGK